MQSSFVYSDDSPSISRTRTRSRKLATANSIHFSGCRQAGRAGDIVLVDLTIFTTLFGGTESLDRFWTNLAVRT
jgi:hypothetical protein